LKRPFTTLLETPNGMAAKVHEYQIAGPSGGFSCNDANRRHYMKATKPRFFTLFDAVVMIAATASALALYRLMPSGGPRLLGFVAIVQYPVEVILPLLIMWSLAVAGLSLREPRPVLRKLACQPGTIACCAASLLLVIEVLAAILGDLVFSPTSVVPRTIPPYVAVTIPQRVLHNLRGMIMLQASAGGAVAASWLIMALGGMWRATPTWLDRTGRALGISWIGVNIALHAVILL
jgi:hypothetical protein